jgi:hypothetical protein
MGGVPEKQTENQVKQIVGRGRQAAWFGANPCPVAPCTQLYSIL